MLFINGAPARLPVPNCPQQSVPLPQSLKLLAAFQLYPLVWPINAADTDKGSFWCYFPEIDNPASESAFSRYHSYKPKNHVMSYGNAVFNVFGVDNAAKMLEIPLVRTFSVSHT